MLSVCAGNATVTIAMTPETPKPTETEVPPWRKRKEVAETLCAGATLLSEEEAMQLRDLSIDVKWEVRKVVAEALSTLPEALYKELSPVLSCDSNAFVSNAARRSSERRIPSANLNLASPGKIQQAVEKMAAKHGSAAAFDARKLADLIIERHIRAAVHDIKNILSGMRLDSKTFLELPPAGQRKKLERFQQNTEYLRHLAEMMAQYSAEPEIKRQSESLSVLISESCTAALEQIGKSGRNLSSMKILQDVPDNIFVEVSRFHIVMVLTNLVKNGVEAHAVSPTEMKPGTVRVAAKLADGCVLVAVSDTGRGIAPADLAQLREFIPGSSSKNKSGLDTGSGTGYGLPICRRYIESHGGSLAIDSIDGQGTTVEIRFPSLSKGL
jgi:signal transduction histidine kinase